MGNWPKPSDSPGTSVSNTAPWSSPTTAFAGRALDSQMQRQWQTPLRTLRARTMRIVPELNRLYAICGSALVGYDLASFFTRLSAREAMVPSTFYGATNRGEFPELILAPNRFWNAEAAPGWVLNHVDGDDRLYGFDVDDRGFVLVATSPYGWGIIDQNFGNVHQGDIDAFKVLSVKSGGRYYAVVTSGNGPSRVYDVTEPLNPIRKPDVPFSIVQFSKAANGDVAIIEGSGRLKVYSPDGLIAGQSKAEVPINFNSIDTDGVNFYAASQANFSGATNATLTILTASGNGYAEQSGIDLGRPYANLVTVRYGADHLLVFGQEAFVPGSDSTAASNLRLYKVSGASITPVPMLVPGTNRQYFASYYSKTYAPGGGFVGPDATGIDGASWGDAALLRSASKTLLGVAAGGLWDWYEISLAGISDQLIAVFTFAPASPQPGQAVAFTDLSIGPVTSRSWTFGDGTGSTLQNPTKSYNSAGSFTVTLTVSNAAGKTASTSKLVTVADIIAAFTFSPASPQPGQAVAFTDQSTGPVISRSWTFENGTGSTLQNPTTSYSSAGSFVVTLTITNAAGKTVSTSTTVTVKDPGKLPLDKNNCFIGDLAPTAKVGESVYMRVQTILWQITDEVVEWNFGDGPGAVSLDPIGTIYHTWTAAATYIVKLTVRRGSQQLDVTQAINITGRTDVEVNATNTKIAVRELDADPAKPLLVGHPINLYAKTIEWSRNGSEPHVWDFKDGTPPSTDKEPAHVYAAPGTYEVALTLTTGAGPGVVKLSVTIVEDVKLPDPLNPDGFDDQGKPWGPKHEAPKPANMDDPEVAAHWYRTFWWVDARYNFVTGAHVNVYRYMALMTGEPNAFHRQGHPEWDDFKRWFLDGAKLLWYPVVTP